jgi:hypothetical protein
MAAVPKLCAKEPWGYAQGCFAFLRDTAPSVGHHVNYQLAGGDGRVSRCYCMLWMMPYLGKPGTW